MTVFARGLTRGRSHPAARATAIGALTLATACAPSSPTMGGRPAAPPAPNSYWTPPSGEVTSVPMAMKPIGGGPTLRTPDISHLSLADVVDLALRNNPLTRLSWASAMAAADEYGATKGLLYPSLTFDAAVSRSLSAPVAGGLVPARTLYGPTATLSYMVLDFGRSGRIDVARKTAVATSLTHNVVVQNTILATETAVFNLLGTAALREAQRAAVTEATTNLAAAEDRHEVGLATIADVLQAKTALAQAQLNLETLDGTLDVSRGTVAVAMGLAATTPFDVPDVVASDSVDFISMSVDSLIRVAERARPDLASAQAQVAAAAAGVRVAASANRPALALISNSGYTGSEAIGSSGKNYTVGLGLQLPVFTGFANEYRTNEAGDQLVAAQARAEQMRQEITLEVLTAYSGLQTSTRRVHTAAELLQTAQQSEEVALGRYREGVGSIVDLLVAELALADARAQSIQARWQWRQALAQLSHDVGTLGIHGEPALSIDSAPGK